MNILPRDDSLVFPHILRVEASAGSGKTYLLAQRFVQFLLSERIKFSDLSNILAITFTNEATSEMKRRIIAFLKRVAIGDDVVASQLSELLSIDQSRMEHNANSLLDRLFIDYGRFQVKTIDSFMFRLISSAPKELGLTAQHDIVFNESAYLREALDRIFLLAEEQEELSSRLKHLVRYCLGQSRGGWWPIDLIFRSLSEFYSKESSYGMEIALPPKTGVRLDDLRTIAANLWDRCASLRLKFKKWARDAFYKFAFEKSDPWNGGKLFTYSNLKDLLLKSSPHPDSKSISMWRDLHKGISQYILYRSRMDLGIFLQVFKDFKGQLWDISYENHIIFISSINMLAMQLSQSVVLPEIFLRLGDRLHHFLLDEFQDTSRLQWDNLCFLLENALAEYGSLFCVGDQKQLLYRWRGSDPQCFEDVFNSFPSVPPEGYKDISLDYNWRSFPEILRFVSEVFSRENLEKFVNRFEKDLTSDFIVKNFKNVEQKVPPALKGSYKSASSDIRVWLFSGEDMEEANLKRKIALKRLFCKQLFCHYRPRDIMVLVRRNQDVEEITSLLSQIGIPVISHRLLDIRKDRIVQGLINLLFALKNPESDIYLASGISSPVFSSLTFNNTRHPEASDTISTVSALGLFELYQTDYKSEYPYFYLFLKSEYPYFWNKYFKELFIASTYMSPYDLLSMAVRGLDVKMRFPGHLYAIDQLLETVFKLEGQGITDIDSVVDFIFRGEDQDFSGTRLKGIDAVRVMTVHKAKGLEAPVVVLVWNDGNILPKYTVHREADQLAIYTLKRTCSDELETLYRSERQRLLLDELNVIYVALTRPKRDLYVLGVRSSGQKRKSVVGELLDDWCEDYSLALGDSAPDDALISCNGLHETDTAVENEECQLDVQVSRPSWPTNLIRRAIDLSDVVSVEKQKILSYGTNVHALLSELPPRLPISQDCKEISSFILETFSERLSGITNDIDVSGLSESLGEILSSSDLYQVFWPSEYASVWTERDICSPSGNIYRIDRLVVDGQNIWVIEYKTGYSRRRRDSDQLRRYLSLISQMYGPDYSVTGFLIYVEQKDYRKIELT